VFITVVLFFRFRVHGGKLGQVTNFTIVGSTAKHCVDQYTWFCFTTVRKGRHCYAGWATS